MKKVIVITGASSGFGALAARALAKAGHVMYASIRDTKRAQRIASGSGEPVRAGEAG